MKGVANNDSAYTRDESIMWCMCILSLNPKESWSVYIKSEHENFMVISVVSSLPNILQYNGLNWGSQKNMRFVSGITDENSSPVVELPCKCRLQIQIWNTDIFSSLVRRFCCHALNSMGWVRNLRYKEKQGSTKFVLTCKPLLTTCKESEGWYEEKQLDNLRIRMQITRVEYVGHILMFVKSSKDWKTPI